VVVLEGRYSRIVAQVDEEVVERVVRHRSARSRGRPADVAVVAMQSLIDPAHGPLGPELIES
jgi:pyruvate/oxaloacetate carboxyltransferase